MPFFLIDELNIPERYLDRVVLTRGRLRVRFRSQSDSIEKATILQHLKREKEGKVVVIEGTLYPKSTQDISGRWRLEKVYGQPIRVAEGNGVRVILLLTPTN